MNALYGVVGLVTSFFTGRFLYRTIFDDSQDFWDCVTFSLTPDLFSLFRGQYWEDQIKSFKLGLFVSATIGSGVVVGLLLHHLFG